MPTCIYCGKTAPSNEFDNEHVVSRAISGTGANWTLVDLVCGDCNNRFSTYEVHVYQQSVESLARTFMGPTGRGKPVNGYVEPMKLNHLYAIEAQNPLVYEGGFSLPGQFYLRPQLIQELDGGFSALLSNQADSQRFQDAISDLVTLRTDALTLERIGRDYLVVPLEYRGGNTLFFKPEEIRSKPTSCWLRTFPEAQRVPSGKKLSPRFAVREDGTSFLRAAFKLSALNFLNTLLAQGTSPSRPSKPASSVGSQQFVFLHTIDLSKVMATMIKTGMNLVCRLYGEQVARDPVFNTLRSLVLGVPLDLVQLQTFCSMSADATDFPAPASSLAQHRFMIDVHNGQVRFRMRLYAHMAYTAILAAALPAGLSVGTERVILDYDGAGIRQVSAWP
jgi:hypothetical protein